MRSSTARHQLGTWIAVAAALVFLLMACGSDGSDDSDAGATPAEDGGVEAATDAPVVPAADTGRNDEDAPACAPGLIACAGACVDTRTDLHHCGACAVDCAALPGAGPDVACAAGSCVLGCAENRADCNGDTRDGCEADLTAPATCGSCATPCGDEAPFCDRVVARPDGGADAGGDSGVDGGAASFACSGACRAPSIACRGACITPDPTGNCDDGNDAAGDGCRNDCRVEPGWTCTGSPSKCVTRCGDGIRAGNELCDDANPDDADACANDCMHGTCTVGGTHPTIQAAVNDARCTQVHVPAGTYNEQVTAARPVVIYGDGAATTVVNGARTAPVFTVSQGPSTLRGMTARNGRIGVRSTATLLLDAMRIADNGSDEAGGVRHTGAGTLTLCTGTVVEKNTARGAIARGGGIHATGGTVTIGCGSIVRQNVAAATGAEAAGGGVYSGGALIIDNASILTNEARVETVNAVAAGGGVYGGAGVTLRNGARVEVNSASALCAGACTAQGGGVHAVGALLVSDSKVTGSLAQASASGGAGNAQALGGGVFARSSATFTRSSLSSNLAKSASGAAGTAFGGGIHGLNVSLAFADSDVSLNVVEGNGSITGTGAGGAISIRSDAASPVATAMLTGCTLAYNQVSSAVSATVGNADARGGAISAHVGLPQPSTATVRTILVNSTLSNNRVTASGKVVSARGGAISNVAASPGTEAQLSAYSSTIASNAAATGGGVYTSGAVSAMVNSILAGNTAPTGRNCAGGVTSTGYLLIDDAAGCTYVAGTGDVAGLDPKLAALAANGGRTQTRALNAGSPAINAGDPAGCKGPVGVVLSTDQRGTSRNGRWDPLESTCRHASLSIL